MSPHTYAQNYKKIRSKHFANPLILPYPAEITSLVSHNNFVEFTSPKNISGAAVIQLVQEVSTEEVIIKENPLIQRCLIAFFFLLLIHWQLLPSIPRTNAEYRKPAPPPGMADIEETKVVVSLRCPLGYFRIEHPAKGIHCNHLQCFDVKVRTYPLLSPCYAMANHNTFSITPALFPSKIYPIVLFRVLLPAAAMALPCL